MKDRLHYTKRYESTPNCKLGLKHLCTICQPDPESAMVVELPIGSGEVVEEGHITIHKVSAHVYRYFTEVMDFFRCQVMSRL